MSLTCPKGEIETNLARHSALLAEGRDAGCDLVLLPEMSLTGYCPAAATSLSDPAVQELVRQTWTGPDLCFGLAERSMADTTADTETASQPDSAPGSEPDSAPGSPPYITQVLASGGRIVTVHHKAWLGEGEDGDFQGGTPAAPFTVQATACSMAVCAEIGTEAPYGIGSTLVLAPAAPGLYGERRLSDGDWQRGFDWWRGSVLDDAARLLGPDRWLAVSTQAGATVDEDFPGWAALVGPRGDVVAELPDWREGTLVVTIPPSDAGR